jgi:hypothetical protein
MKRAIIGTLGFILFAIVGIVGYFVIQPLRYYHIEGSIHAEFYPLIPALDGYCDVNRKAPEKLEDLVPEYLNELPSLGKVSEIRYRYEPKEPRWRLTLVSEATGDLRYYIAETGIPLSELEKKDLVLRYHSRWSVLEPKLAEDGGGESATSKK